MNVQKAGWVQYVQSCGKIGTLLERKGWLIQRRQILTEKRRTNEWISTRRTPYIARRETSRADKRERGKSRVINVPCTRRDLNRNNASSSFIEPFVSKRQRQAQSVNCLPVDLAVATVLPFTLLPVGLVVHHLGALVVVASVVQGVLQTTLATLTKAAEAQSHDNQGSDRSGSDVDANVGAFRKSSPLLRQGLLVELLQSR